MQFGVCAAPEQADLAKRFGWDFVELNVQNAFKGTSESWDRLPTAALPLPAANSLVPGAMKIVGPSIDSAALKAYIDRVVQRAASIDCRTLVFGSGVARHVPDGWDRATARRQIVEFLKLCADAGAANDVTFVIEPLQKGETNILNSLGESLSIVREFDHPRIKQLVDSYHFWLEDDALDAIRDAGQLIQHVHVADKEGRVAPGESGKSDYSPFFRALKDIGYDRRISVECLGLDFARHGERVLAFLKREWSNA